VSRIKIRIARTYNKPRRFDVFVESVNDNDVRLPDGFYIECEADSVLVEEWVSHPNNADADVVWEAP